MTVVSGVLLVVTILHGAWAGALEYRLPSLRQDSATPPRPGLPWSLRDPGLLTPEGQEQRSRALRFLRRMYFFGLLFFVSRCAGL